MSEAHNPIPQGAGLKTAAKTGWALLIPLTLYVCYFSHLGAVGFVGPDEPRYAWIARDMAETGDWVTPRLYGKPWFEKPPLLYWGAALSFKLFGVSEAAARLPSAVCALLATLALAWLAWRLYGAETARWLLLLLPTAVGMMGFSHAAATDMPFSGMLTIAMVCAALVLGLLPPPRAGSASADSPIGAHNAVPRPGQAVSVSDPGAGLAPLAATTSAARSTPWLALILFGVFLGLAVLAKGPAAIVLSGGAVFFWVLFTRRFGDAFRLFHPAAVAAFCLTALPWYILCARRNPDFLRIFIIEHNFKRYLTPEFQHLQPFWFYLPVLLVAFLPWTTLFLWSSLAGTRIVWRTRSIPAATWFFICWAGFCVVFFSVSRSKLPGYVLPAVPAIGVLMARDVDRRLQQKIAAARGLCLGLSLTLAALGVVAGLEGEKIPFDTDIRPASAVLQFYALMVLAGIAVGILAVLRRVRVAIVLGAIALPAFLTSGTTNWGELDEGVSARPVALEAKRSFPGDLLEGASTYKLQRGLKFALNFYFRRELPEWSPPGGRRGIIFTSHRGSQELQHKEVACLTYIAYPAVEICADAIRPTSLMHSRSRSGELR